MSKPKTYTVTLSRVEYLSATVEVVAENEEQAKALAMDEAPDWNCRDAEQEVMDVEEV